MNAPDATLHARQQLYRDMDPLHLTPLWEVLHALVPPKPATPCVPAHWRYEQVRPFLMRAGQAITAEEAVRRVLILENPGLRGQSAVTQSLYAGLQLILPGELAPAHRHTQSALRFIVEGHGAYTAVDGERTTMRPGDSIITPILDLARPRQRWRRPGGVARWTGHPDDPVLRCRLRREQQRPIAAGHARRRHEPGPLRAQHGAGAARVAVRRHLADLQLPLRAQPGGAAPAGARCAPGSLGRRQAALREPADRRLPDAHHGNLPAEAAGRLRGHGPGARPMARCTAWSKAPARSTSNGPTSAGASSFGAARSFRRSVMAHCPASLAGRVRPLQLLGPARAGRRFHPQGRKVVMSFVITPPAQRVAARRGPRRALPGAPRVLRGPQLRRARQGDGLHRPRAALLLLQAGRCAWCPWPPARPAPWPTPASPRTCTTRSNWWRPSAPAAATSRPPMRASTSTATRWAWT